MSNFKSIKDYNAEKYAGKFFLKNDGDSADVIFLYRNEADVLKGDAHYIATNEYSGYVECNGVGCAACASGVRKDTRMFIPLYNIQHDCIEFWDRRARGFESVLETHVLACDPNPSSVVFRITRRGEANSRDTRYEIVALAMNDVMTYDEICAKFNAKFPEYYSTICKEVDNATLSKWLSSKSRTAGGYNQSSYSEDYTPIPRVSVAADPINLPPTFVEGDDDFSDAEFE